VTSRRQFLRTGLLGTLLLATLRAVPAQAQRALSRTPLSAEQRAVLTAVAPVLLAGALPEGEQRADAVRAVVDGVEQAIAGLPPHLQAELDQLFTLLTFAPTRWLVVGVSSPWPRASAAEVGAFLESWRTSWLALLQSGYHALHELVMAAWYARPESWTALRYPGPPVLP
jgi:hypothetical protein